MSAHRPVHLVFVHRRYAALILAGTKTEEIRLAKTRRLPFGQVEQGDRLYFKVVSGTVVATALALSVESHADLTHSRIISLAKEHGPRLCAQSGFMTEKRDARYATIIRFASVEPTLFGPSCSEPMQEQIKGSVRDAWRVLPASCDVYPQCLGSV